jgi:hypothetical protein
MLQKPRGGRDLSSPYVLAAGRVAVSAHLERPLAPVRNWLRQRGETNAGCVQATWPFESSTFART